MRDEEELDASFAITPQSDIELDKCAQEFMNSITESQMEILNKYRKCNKLSSLDLMSEGNLRKGLNVIDSHKAHTIRRAEIVLQKRYYKE